ncbi:energy transducer TonB [Massilia sp. W12]|uniref:energy transducer TonB n=1 Tax=Massilia sp. W12 TaxID=3126507 RepID=UPI0030D172CF
MRALGNFDKAGLRSLCALLLAAPCAVLAADVVAALDAKAPCEKPAYPRASLMNEEKGTVLMGFLIAADGRVVESKIEKSSGFKGLDKAAISALSQCKFKPASKDGKPEQGWAKVEYTWKLE